MTAPGMDLPNRCRAGGLAPIAMPAMLAFVLAAGCATTRPRPAVPDPAPVQSIPEPEMSSAPEPEPVEVEGMTGSLPAVDIRYALAPRADALARCQLTAAQPEEATGRMRLHFRVDGEGDVLRVSCEESTIANRDVEECLLRVARQTSFPRPNGGREAEFSWPLELLPPEEPAPAPEVSFRSRQ